MKYETSNEYCDQSFMREQVKVNQESVFLISQQVTGTNDARRLHSGLSENPPTDFLCGHSVNKTQLRDQTHSKAFLTLLNSKFMDWFFRITSTNNNVQGYELEQLPIPEMTEANRRRLSRLANRVLKVKASNPSADTSELEEEIDWLVYDLYGLTNEETAVVADFFWDGTLSEEEENQALLRAMKEGDIDDRVSLEEVLQTLRPPDDC